MAYENRNRGRGGGGFTTRLTGLFEMRSGRGSVGTLRPEDLDALIGVIRAARADGRSITFFVWNGRSRRDLTSLAVCVAQPADESESRSRTDRSDRARPIDDDEIDREPEPCRAAPADRRRSPKPTDDPFGLD